MRFAICLILLSLLTVISCVSVNENFLNRFGLNDVEYAIPFDDQSGNTARVLPVGAVANYTNITAAFDWRNETTGVNIVSEEPIITSPTNGVRAWFRVGEAGDDRVLVETETGDTFKLVSTDDGLWEIIGKFGNVIPPVSPNQTVLVFQKGSIDNKPRIRVRSGASEGGSLEGYQADFGKCPDSSCEGFAMLGFAVVPDTTNEDFFNNGLPNQYPKLNEENVLYEQSPSDIFDIHLPVEDPEGDLLTTTIVSGEGLDTNWTLKDCGTNTTVELDVPYNTTCFEFRFKDIFIEQTFSLSFSYNVSDNPNGFEPPKSIPWLGTINIDITPSYVKPELLSPQVEGTTPLDTIRVTPEYNVFFQESVQSLRLLNLTSSDARVSFKLYNGPEEFKPPTALNAGREYSFEILFETFTAPSVVLEYELEITDTRDNSTRASFNTMVENIFRSETKETQCPESESVTFNLTVPLIPGYSTEEMDYICTSIESLPASGDLTVSSNNDCLYPLEVTFTSEPLNERTQRFSYSYTLNTTSGTLIETPQPLEYEISIETKDDPPTISPGSINMIDGDRIQVIPSVNTPDLDKNVTSLVVHSLPSDGILVDENHEELKLNSTVDLNGLYYTAPYIPGRSSLSDEFSLLSEDNIGQRSDPGTFSVEIENSLSLQLSPVIGVERNLLSVNVSYLDRQHDRNLTLHFQNGDSSIGVFVDGNSGEPFSDNTVDLPANIAFDARVLGNTSWVLFLEAPTDTGNVTRSPSRSLGVYIQVGPRTSSITVANERVSGLTYESGTEPLAIENALSFSNFNGDNAAIIVRVSTNIGNVTLSSEFESFDLDSRSDQILFNDTVKNANEAFSVIQYALESISQDAEAEITITVERANAITYTSAAVLNQHQQSNTSTSRTFTIQITPNSSAGGGNNNTGFLVGVILGPVLGGLAVLVILTAIIIISVYFIRRRALVPRKELPPDFERLAFGEVTPLNLRQKRFVKRRLNDLEREILTNEYLINGLLEMEGKTDEVVRNLTYITENVGRSVWMIDKLIERELETASRETLLRANNAACKVMTVYTKIVGLEYLHNTIGQNIKDIMADVNANVEVNPHKLDEEEDADANRWTLMAVTQRLLNNVLRSVPDCPEQFRVICRILYNRCKDQFDKECANKAVGSFFFLRFIGPAVATPHTYGILPPPEPQEDRRKLVSLSKVIMNLANGVQFGAKESGFEALNEFIKKNTEHVNSFYQEVGSVDTDPLSLPAIRLPKGLRERAIYDLYTIIKDNTQALEGKISEMNNDNSDKAQQAIDLIRTYHESTNNSGNDNVEMVETIDV